MLVLKRLTNGRYPSFYTLGHVFWGSDNYPSVSQKWLEDKNYDLFNKKIKNGISIATLYNRRAFGGIYKRRGIDHMPLFVFETHNPRFKRIDHTYDSNIPAIKKVKEEKTKREIAHIYSNG